jgi:prevent-host-death family protein
MTAAINIHEAKTHFSKLLARVEAGEEIIIAKAGKPVAKLRPIKKQAARRVLGQDRGLFTVPPEFDDPLPELEEYM